MEMSCSFVALPSDAGAEPRTARVSELSEDGLFLASNCLYPPGTALSLVLEIPGKRLPVRLRGRVGWARTKDPAGMYVSLAQTAAAEAMPERGTTIVTEADGTKKPRGPEPLGS